MPARSPDGRVLVWGPKGRELERDLVSCPHCEAPIELVGGSPAGEAAWCDQCGKFVCATAACASACIPFVKQIEQRLDRDYHRQQFARTAGLER